MRMSEVELCAKVILVAAGDSEVTIERGQSNDPRWTVHGSVPGGAHARLERLSRENPGHLLRLLERVQPQFSWLGMFIVSVYM